MSEYTFKELESLLVIAVGRATMAEALVADLQDKLARCQAPVATETKAAYTESTRLQTENESLRSDFDMVTAKLEAAERRIAELEMILENVPDRYVIEAREFISRTNRRTRSAFS